MPKQPKNCPEKYDCCIVVVSGDLYFTEDK